jgi:hypothetical protein
MGSAAKTCRKLEPVGRASSGGVGSAPTATESTNAMSCALLGTRPWRSGLFGVLGCGGACARTRHCVCGLCQRQRVRLRLVERRVQLLLHLDRHRELLPGRLERRHRHVGRVEVLVCTQDLGRNKIDRPRSTVSTGRPCGVHKVSRHLCPCLQCCAPKKVTAKYLSIWVGTYAPSRWQ